MHTLSSRLVATGIDWLVRIVGLLSTLLRTFLRGVPLFFAARPRTPLRVLCIMAFDTTHALRRTGRLPHGKLALMAAWLDFAACLNRFFDQKEFCRREYRAVRGHLNRSGLRHVCDEYVEHLRRLESGRPGRGSDEWRFRDVQGYREEVVKLSLGGLAAIVFQAGSVVGGIWSTERDEDLQFLFRMAMQCQIIDDLLDYTGDMAADLPSFLTTTHPLQRALILTKCAAREYECRPVEFASTGYRIAAVEERALLRAMTVGLAMIARLLLILQSLRCDRLEHRAPIASGPPWIARSNQKAN